MAGRWRLRRPFRHGKPYQELPPTASDLQPHPRGNGSFFFTPSGGFVPWMVPQNARELLAVLQAGGAGGGIGGDGFVWILPIY